PPFNEVVTAGAMDLVRKMALDFRGRRTSDSQVGEPCAKRVGFETVFAGKVTNVGRLIGRRFGSLSDSLQIIGGAGEDPLAARQKLRAHGSHVAQQQIW